MTRLLRRWAALGAVLALLAGIFVGAAPAYACACGGYVAPAGAAVEANSERAVIALAQGQETVVLSMGALTQATDVALLIPSPAPATVERGGEKVFDELARATAPVATYVDDWWGAGLDGRAGAAPQAAPGPVSVLSQVQLGELEVTTLAASDAGALTAWLTGHGYEMREGMTRAVQPYVAEGWYYAAVRLRPEAAATVSGDMQPLVLRFASDKVVYPMRLSAAAAHPQTVSTYVFAEHRMDRSDVQARTATLGFAGRVSPADFKDPLLAELAALGYLTAHQQKFWTPATDITADFTFVAAATDSPFRATYTLTRPVTLLGAPAGPVLLGAGGAALLVLALIITGRRRERHRQR